VEVDVRFIRVDERQRAVAVPGLIFGTHNNRDGRCTAVMNVCLCSEPLPTLLSSSNMDRVVRSDESE
jgi:hypothetical protein